MGPFLNYLSDNKDHKLSEIIDNLADYFKLTKEERNQLLPSGKGFLFRNRVQWARLYLDKANAIDTPSRGTYRITQRGTDLFKTKPSLDIDENDLMQFPEFKSFFKPTANEVKTATPKSKELEEETSTPDELIENAHQNLRQNLARQLSDNINASSPTFFEALVVDLLIAMGYGGSRKEAAQLLGKSGDEGVDGVIKEDKLGLDSIYIQAKRWNNNSSVGRPEIQRFVGALKGQKAKKGIFITASDFTKDAISYASNLEDPVILINGDQLANLMIDHNVGVSISKTIEIKTIDSDYFAEL